MKVRYLLLASVFSGIIGVISSLWLEDINVNFGFLTSASIRITSILLIISYTLFVINHSGMDPLKHLRLLKQFIIILLVISAITLIACAETIGGNNPDISFVAFLTLISLPPAEIALIIISTIVYYAKKKKYNAAAEEIPEDNSDETKS